MFRLTILTLLGLFAVLTLMGDPDPKTPFNPPEAAAASEARPAEPVTAAPAPAPATIVPASQVQQTPERAQSFPGPTLRPSPEHAGEAEQAQAEQLAESGARVMYVTGNKVNFRAGPSTNDQVIGALLLGSPVEALGETDNGWMQLRDAQGREGYMSVQFLSTDRPN